MWFKRTRCSRELLAVLMVCLVFQTCFGVERRDEPARPAFFGTTNVWTAELRFSAEQWAQFLNGKRAARPDTAANKIHESDRNYIYSHADLNLAGRVITNIGIRLKGGGTQAGVGNSRWPFRIDLDKFGGQTRLDGVSKFSLNNNYYDSSYLRDALSYELFRNFGVPAPRTCFVKVYLTVPGAQEQQYLGLYTAAEAVESPFLKEHFHNDGGLLLKPSFGLNGFPKGTNWTSLRDFLGPKTDGTVEQRQRIVDLFRLVNRANGDEFLETLPKLANLEEYLRFLVVNVVLVNQDSYLGMGKNYYIYVDALTNRANWLPWDLDLSIGGFFFCGTAEERIELDVDRPSSIDDRLIRRILAVPVFRERYHELMKAFVREHFVRDKVFARIDELSAVVQGAVMEEKSTSPAEFEASLDGRTPANLEANRNERRRWMLIEPGLKRFAENRIKSVEAQLAGRREGIRTGFGSVYPWP